MQPSHFHQELARSRYAEHVREAAQRARPADHQLVPVEASRRRRLRLITPRFALRLVPG